eukprot:4886965-Prymnesium_polylepis.2
MCCDVCKRAQSRVCVASCDERQAELTYHHQDASNMAGDGPPEYGRRPPSLIWQATALMAGDRPPEYGRRPPSRIWQATALPNMAGDRPPEYGR